MAPIYLPTHLREEREERENRSTNPTVEGVTTVHEGDRYHHHEGAVVQHPRNLGGCEDRIARVAANAGGMTPAEMMAAVHKPLKRGGAIFGQAIVTE